MAPNHKAEDSEGMLNSIDRHIIIDSGSSGSGV